MRTYCATTSASRWPRLDRWRPWNFWLPPLPLTAQQTPTAAVALEPQLPLRMTTAIVPWLWMHGCVSIRGLAAGCAALWSKISATWLGMQWISVSTKFVGPARRWAVALDASSLVFVDSDQFVAVTVMSQCRFHIFRSVIPGLMAWSSDCSRVGASDGRRAG
jgi:hypothetical protein